MSIVEKFPNMIINVEQEPTAYFVLHMWHGCVIEELSIDVGTDRYMRMWVSSTTNPFFLMGGIPESCFPQEMNKMNGFPDIYKKPVYEEEEDKTEYCECCGRELYEENW